MPSTKRERIWPTVLKIATRKNPPKSFTSRDLADEMDIPLYSAAQVVGRLRRWGYLKLVGFEDPEGGIGRRLHVYVATPMARRYLKHMDKKNGRPSDDE